MKNGFSMQRFEDLSELNVSGSVRMIPGSFEVCLSYHTPHGIQPLSLKCNPKYVSKITWEMAEKFSKAIEHLTDSSDTTIPKDFMGDVLIKFNCLTEETLEHVLGKLKKTAEESKSKLHLIAFPGVGNEYPNTNLCAYRVD